MFFYEILEQDSMINRSKRRYFIIKILKEKNDYHVQTVYGDFGKTPTITIRKYPSKEAYNKYESTINKKIFDGYESCSLNDVSFYIA